MATLTPEINLKSIIEESREIAQALCEFADNLEEIEKKYKCKELGKLPKGYDCALWQAESEEEK